MYSGIAQLFSRRDEYCRLIISYNECKWYQFFEKKIIKRELDFIYPLMRAELSLQNSENLYTKLKMK